MTATRSSAIVVRTAASRAARRSTARSAVHSRYRAARWRQRFEITKYTISANGSSVAIEWTGVAGRQAELLEAFGKCQEGRCSCPTDEYLKVATMEVQPTEDRIAIRLQAKPGTSLDTTEIAACLDYTVGKGDA